MSDAQFRLTVVITVFTLAAGVFDALAFHYSAGMWQGNRLVLPQVGKAAGAFALGIVMYWVAIRYLGEAGVVLPEIQTLIWFAATIVGVAVLGGRFLQLPVLDQIAAANVLLSLGWLIVRTS
jgi:hypothetical protein